MISTIGGLIKDYRIRKRLSQIELSLKIGWNDSTRLSRIEQERAGTPERETVDKIISALGLNTQERGEFLLAGGYLPTEEEVELMVAQYKQRILDWRYPAYLMDFSWRILFLNKSTIDVFHFSRDLLTGKPLFQLNLLDNIIMPLEVEVFKGDDKDSLLPLNRVLVSQFKAEHLGQENDKWYKQLVSNYLKNKNFYYLWEKYTAEVYHKKLREYEYKLVKEKNGSTSIFHIFDSSLINDRRFTLVLYLPAND